MEFSRQDYWSGLPFPSPLYVWTYICIFHCIYSHIHTHTYIPHLLIHVSMNTGCSQVFAVVNNAAINLELQISLQDSDSFPWDTYAGLYGSCYFLIFWDTSILFSIRVVPIHIPTNSVLGFSLIHILKSICISCPLGNNFSNKYEVWF